MSKTASQKLGEMAASALDHLGDGELIGAVLLVAVTAPEIEGGAHYRTLAMTPPEQWFPMTLGIVEDWRVDQQATITGSAVALEFSEDDDEPDED